MPRIDDRQVFEANVDAGAAMVTQAMRTRSVLLFAVGVDPAGEDRCLRVFAAGDLAPHDVREICARIVRMHDTGHLHEVSNGENP